MTDQTDPAEGSLAAPAEDASAAPAEGQSAAPAEGQSAAPAGHEPGYDERRNIIARDKGLPGEVIEGGDDPDPAEGLREDRLYGRLLVGMVVALILGGFVLGLGIALAQS